MRKHATDTGIHPARDWRVLATCAVMLVTLSLCWNVWLLWRAGQGAGIRENGEVQGPASVSSVRALFEVRAQEERRYRQEYRFVDPSR